MLAVRHLKNFLCKFCHMLGVQLRMADNDELILWPIILQELGQFATRFIDEINHQSCHYRLQQNAYISANERHKSNHITSNSIITLEDSSFHLEY